MQESIIAILMKLLAVESITAKELAEDLEISQRTVFRYVDKLNQAHVPVDTTQGRFGGISISPEFKIKANFFTQKEYERLLEILQGFILEDEVTESIINKIKSLKKGKKDFTLKTNQLVVQTNVAEPIKEKIAKLQECIVLNKVAEISYLDDNGTKTTRKIEAYSMVQKDGLWYVYAFCLVRQDFRFFKISRIVDLEICSAKFSARRFNVDASSITTSKLLSKEQIEFVLEVSEKASSHVAEWLGIENLKHEEKLTAEGSMPFDDYLVLKILSFGSEVKVLSPEILKQKVVEHAQKIVNG